RQRTRLSRLLQLAGVRPNHWRRRPAAGGIQRLGARLLARRRQHARKEAEGPLQRIVDRGPVFGRPVAKESVRRAWVDDDLLVGFQHVFEGRDLLRWNAGVSPAEDTK